jgi:hypothetical protein
MSVANKVDDLLEMRRDRSVDILCLTETLHDADSVAFRRLRADDFSVVDRPRPRHTSDNLSTNHGGVAVVATADVRLCPVTTVADSPSSFESLCVQATFGHFAAIVVVIYRPGSSAVVSTFFDELSSLFEAVATFKETVFIVGDFNIRLDRPDDPDTRRFVDIVSCYGFDFRPTSSTHKLGGVIDAVITRADGVHPTVDVVDAGLSDHHLLQWSTPACRSSPPVEIVQNRPWRRLSTDDLRARLVTSPLCCPAAWPDDVDDLAAMYDRELTFILDQLIPPRQYVRRPRPSDPWFDAECLSAKRLTRRLERKYLTACRRATRSTGDDVAAAAAKSAWYAQRRSYRELRQQKRCAFWSATVEAERHNPRQLWKSVDELLGRGRLPANTTITVDQFNRFFADKVDAVRANTATASEPTYSQAPAGVSFTEFQSVNVEAIVSAISQLPDKSSAADPLPAPVLKRVANELAPFLHNYSTVHWPPGASRPSSRRLSSLPS